MWLRVSHETDIPVLEELRPAEHVLLTDGFLAPGLARSLRGVFDKRFADPRAIHPERFLWCARRRLERPRPVTVPPGGRTP